MRRALLQAVLGITLLSGGTSAQTQGVDRLYILNCGEGTAGLTFRGGRQA
jgi:hypothetical protein